MVARSRSTARARLVPLVAPATVRLEPLANGPVGDWAAEAGAFGGVDSRRASSTPPASRAPCCRTRCACVRASGARSRVALPVRGAPPLPTAADFTTAEARAAVHWRDRLDRVRIEGPAEVEDVARTLRTSLGHILVNRSGPALQPGPRAYARSWIRDGALTSSALLRLGQDDVVRDFLLWYAPFQFANGKVPCCATERGADPVPENDSDGEFAFAVNELWQYTIDDGTARTLWPHVRRAIDHMEALRLSERVPANLAAGRRAYFGMMPPSISHEGYSDQPAYSYWDNFWASIGYRSAQSLAVALGFPDDARRIAFQREEFGADLLASLAASTRRHGLDVLPGAADRGDVDPTSSTMALSPGGLLGTLPDALVRNTFERYWRSFTERRDSGKPWDAYTPYEWRNVGALVRLGQRERALEALAFFQRDRRPTGWNQWAEVVLRDAREPRFLGDMPHGWVASDQIRSVLDLFAYEHEGERSMVLAAGVPLAWFDGVGLTVQELRTPYGRLGWQGRASIDGGPQGHRARRPGLAHLPAGRRRAARAVARGCAGAGRRRRDPRRRRLDPPRAPAGARAGRAAALISAA